jgi:hypothetical protein
MLDGIFRLAIAPPRRRRGAAVRRPGPESRLMVPNDAGPHTLVAAMRCDRLPSRESVAQLPKRPAMPEYTPIAVVTAMIAPETTA